MLGQAEADALIAMGKTFLKRKTICLPPGIDESRELVGDDKTELFLLDLWRGTLRLSKYRYQTRGRRIVVLVRVDIDGAPHTNPDGGNVGPSHIHVYREGFEDRWAHPLNPAQFSDSTDIVQTFHDFAAFCSIRDVPPFQETLL